VSLRDEGRQIIRDSRRLIVSIAEGEINKISVTELVSGAEWREMIICIVRVGVRLINHRAEERQRKSSTSEPEWIQQD
jgi:hypothetical protein